MIPPLHVSAQHPCSAAAVALAWTIRDGNVIAIPESGSAEHIKENAVALSLTLTPDEIHALMPRIPRLVATCDGVHPSRLPHYLNALYASGAARSRVTAKASDRAYPDLPSTGEKRIFLGWSEG